MALHPLFIGYASPPPLLIVFATVLTLTISGLVWPCGGGRPGTPVAVALERLDCSLPLFLGIIIFIIAHGICSMTDSDKQWPCLVHQ